jgi:hypothetical protein
MGKKKLEIESFETAKAIVGGHFLTESFEIKSSISDDEKLKVGLRSLWLKVINDPGVNLAHKRWASELLGKSLCMFPQKLEHSGPDDKPLTFNIIIGDKTDA